MGKCQARWPLKLYMDKTVFYQMNTKARKAKFENQTAMPDATTPGIAHFKSLLCGPATIDWNACSRHVVRNWRAKPNSQRPNF